ncbi:MAG: glycoside hydrolase family 92 protein [Bacteroidetes bacterium]|nr:MAG: glycoside hydrolase family 92 protein [Bacteroidota bacterium]
MFKQFSLNVLIGGIFVLLHGWANGQINELRKSSDQARKKLGMERQVSRRQRMDYTKFVNPFIGTGGHGHSFPAATMPFGMMQLGPDTRYSGWDGCSGYHYSDSMIYGFSHTHLSGTGVPDLCDLLIVPQVGEAKTVAAYHDPNGYGAIFSHQNEKAEPGYYEVLLEQQNIHVKLASTAHSGIHEYTFGNKKGKKYLLIDLEHRDELLDVRYEILDKRKISGSRISKSWASKQHFYFFLESEIPAKKIHQIDERKILLEFPAKTKIVRIKVGISAVDEQGAQQNLFQEIPDFDLNRVKNRALWAWNQELGKIHFSSDDPEVMSNFYTALYHSYICPVLFSDVDGRFRGNDGAIHQDSKHQRYSIFSLWDTYRATHPLYNITQRKKNLDFIHSFLGIYDETGELPVWELWGNETDCMIGYHATSVIQDAYAKGVRGFDLQKAFQAMKATALKKELGKDHYAAQGFISSDLEAESVSKTLEYAYNDWTISNFAKVLGDAETAHQFAKRSFSYLNIFNPTNKFMQARIGGSFVHHFDPAEVNFNYTEANSWQYSLYVPQDIRGLRYVIGGKDSLESWLDRLFKTKSELSGRHQVDITGLIGQYAHGNEPSHHMAYLYNYTNAPAKSQEVLNRIMKEMYQNAPDGLSGNEDCGQMSSWYVFSALGFYPVCPGSTSYQFGRPLANEAGIHLENGKSFYIRTKNNSPDNKYIQEIKLNGNPYNKLYLEHEAIMAGGELEFIMGPEPQATLENYSQDINESASFPFPFDLVPTPYFESESSNFIDSLQIKISALPFPETQIHYTVDGTQPGLESPVYQRPFTIHKTTTVKAKIFRRGDERVHAGHTVSSTFKQLDPGTKLELFTSYSNQYAAGGNSALIDGRKGGKDFRSGAWQGYEGINAHGKINFEKGKKLNQLSIRCLQDIKSWIFVPTEIRIKINYEGEASKMLLTKSFELPANEFGQFIETLEFSLDPNKTVSSIEFEALNRGVCPEGHLGAGGKSWIFLDEIEFH